MRALYSLVCRLRTLCALTQGTVTLISEGWAALAPAQWLFLGCGLTIVLRILVPSPPPRTDRLLTLLAAGSVVAMMVAGAIGSGVLLGRLVLGF